MRIRLGPFTIILRRFQLRHWIYPIKVHDCHEPVISHPFFFSQPLLGELDFNQRNESIPRTIFCSSSCSFSGLFLCVKLVLCNFYFIKIWASFLRTQLEVIIPGILRFPRVQLFIPQCPMNIVKIFTKGKRKSKKKREREVVCCVF